MSTAEVRPSGKRAEGIRAVRYAIASRLRKRTPQDRVRAELRGLWESILDDRQEVIDAMEQRLLKDAKARLSQEQPKSDVVAATAKDHTDQLYLELADKFTKIPDEIQVYKFQRLRSGLVEVRVDLPNDFPWEHAPREEPPSRKNAPRRGAGRGYTLDSTDEDENRYTLTSFGFHQLVGEFRCLFGDRWESLSVFPRWIPNPFWQYASVRSNEYA